MGDFLRNLFSSDLMGHGYCYLWKPEIVWLHVVSDSLITFSYYLIPFTLIRFVRKRRDLPFEWIFVMFGIFIFGCGTTHLMDVWTLWHGTYRLAGLIKAITAGASVATAALLVPLVPRALALPSPAQLETANRALEKEIGERRRIQSALQKTHDELEIRVRMRTAELAQANEQLRAEITERKRAEEILRKQADLLDLAHDAIIVRDQEGKLTYWNSGAEAIYGWRKEEALGKVAKVLLDSGDPPELENLVSAVTREGRWEGELAQTRRDGRRIVVVSRWVFQRDESGNPPVVLQINTDVTEQRQAAEALRQSEARWRAVFESSAAGIVLADPSGRFLAVNRAYQNMLGYSERESLNMAYLDVLHEDVRESSRGNFAELLSGKLLEFESDRLIRRKDGDFIWGHVHVSVVRGPSGGPQFVMAIVRDVTERKRTEETLQAAKAQLAHMARVTTIGELGASIAHEVNQPLAAVVTNANACLRWLNAAEPNLWEVREALTRIVKEGSRAGEVIGRIRSLMKKSPPNLSLLHINDLINEVLVLTQHEILKHGVSVRTELAADLPRLLGDPVQLQQVVLNLVMNAIEATSASSEGSRELLLTSQKRGEDQILVTAQDSGSGIHPATADQLFKPFFTTKATGMGMGLSISRSIIEAHGGLLWAVPNQGHGATFQFSLPAGERDG